MSHTYLGVFRDLVSDKSRQLLFSFKPEFRMSTRYIEPVILEVVESDSHGLLLCDEGNSEKELFYTTWDNIACIRAIKRPKKEEEPKEEKEDASFLEKAAEQARTIQYVQKHLMEQEETAIEICQMKIGVEKSPPTEIPLPVDDKVKDAFLKRLDEENAVRRAKCLAALVALSDSELVLVVSNDLLACSPFHRDYPDQLARALAVSEAFLEKNHIITTDYPIHTCAKYLQAGWVL